MSPRAPARAAGPPAAAAGVQPVLLLLWVLMLLCLAVWPVLGESPNRILTPVGVPLPRLLTTADLSSLCGALAAVLLALGALAWRGGGLKPGAQLGWVLAAVGMGLLAAVSGRYAEGVWAARGSGRFVLAGGFWSLMALLWLYGAQAQRILSGLASPNLTGPEAARRGGWWRGLIPLLLPLLLWAPLVGVILSGRMERLSLWQEYRSNADLLATALTEHLGLLALTLLITTPLGLLLGLRSAARPRFGRICLGILGLLQTVPSLALFGLLMTPLSALSQAVPALAALGIKGIGVAPAVLALVAYSLLPMVRATVAGLEQVPPAVLDAARGMGMTPTQVRWQVHVRLALPVLLSGLRVTAVQAVGLTVVAALIGAGGLGALMFRGLSASALDLVLLGVIPVVALAALINSLLTALEGLARVPGSTPDAAPRPSGDSND